ncbi:heme-binding protein 2-like [Pseudophryne corroboree]|uniref:heme-binding protein 2-like n=1 Tax=Pseudophryne corroboree TaxID=495146 RepID=UPI003081CE50
MESRNLMLLSWLAVLVVAEEPPSFCKLDCPKYQLVEQYDKFEHRIYEESRWVTTSLNADHYMFGIMNSFRHLFKYISGENSEGLKINMTVPVLTVVPLIKPPTVNATMSFFVPHALENPPTPSDPAVYLKNSPPMSVYVKTFGGYAFDYTYSKKAKALAEELRTLGLQFDDSFVLRAGYDAPFKLFDRHNEVWFLAK